MVRYQGLFCLQWPGVPSLREPQHAQLPLLGGAAFERCMSEFQTAVASLSFPSGETALPETISHNVFAPTKGCLTEPVAACPRCSYIANVKLKPCAMCCLACAVAQAHVANVVLALGLRGHAGSSAAEQAARQVGRAQARALLLPLLDHAIARLSAVMRRTWQLAVDHALPDGVPALPTDPERMLTSVLHV